MNDLRFAFRQLRKSPGFSLIAIATLALGIGANTAIFSVVESSLLRPLPFPQADRLVRLYELSGASGAQSTKLNLAPTILRQWRENSGEIFEGIGAATGASLTLGANAGESARNLPAALVSANFFDVVGLPPVLGRNFLPAEDAPGADRVAIVGYDFWQQNLGGRADALSKTVQLDGLPYTVVGVMPKTYRHPYRAEVWLPLRTDYAAERSQHHYLYGVARLKPGLTIAQAQAATDRMCAALKAITHNPAAPERTELIPLRDSFIFDLRPKLLIIGGAALCALLVAAANFAGLLLSRAVERGGEMAMRAALGASRGRLVRQGLIQSLLLTALGTLCGLLVAGWLTPLLVAMSPEGADNTGSAIREFDYTVRLDWPVFAFAAGTMIVVGLSDRPNVMLISQAGARKVFGNENPIGKTLLVTSASVPTQIIGVVGDVRSERVAQRNEMEFYRPWAQENFPFLTLTVRSTLPPSDITGLAQKALASIDPSLAIAQPQMMSAIVAQSLGQARLTTILLGLFAGVALLLASVGIYGAVAYTVEQRKGEIGVRMALGAQTMDVLRLVVRQGMSPVLMGLVIGLGAALALGRLLTTQLYEVSATNPLFLGGTATLLAVVGLCACLIPARRATLVNPIEALRNE